ncbi:MAG: 4-hydroxybenzoate octaprenyltransferase [Rhodospirillaceae bacterium]|nr:4-hydroxybenzoate octaprenyltransferase [Rhodospirillaceae bacterium]
MATPGHKARLAGSDGAVDIPHGSWIDRYAPETVAPYLTLMRLDRPIGWWLLLFPCWWGLALAPHADGYGWRDLWFAALFLVGAVVMRGAGCTVNDIFDRKIDGQVARTRTRPIASGRITVAQALVFLAVQLLVGLAILVQFNAAAVWVAIASLGLVVVYPLMKRVTWWPQAVLGITFNWGALVGWVAVTGRLDWAPVVLYLSGALWTIGYDTVYAHQDKADDARVGVKSTALKWGDASKPWVLGFYVAAVAGMTAAGVLAGLHAVFLGAMAAGLAFLLLQLRQWRPDDPADCLRKFKNQRIFAWIVLAGFVVGRIAGG